MEVKEELRDALLGEMEVEGRGDSAGSFSGAMEFPRNLTNYRKLLIKWKRKTRLQSLRLAARRANGTNGLL